MKGFFYSNQSLVIVLGVVLFLVILYFIIKALPTKVLKKQKEEKKEEKIEEKKEEPEMVQSDESLEQEKTQEEEIKDKKTDKKPKIVQVFKRESIVKDESSDNKKAHDPIYDRNVEFVNTSKNVAKFKSFAEENKEGQTEEKSTDEFGFVEDVKEDCEFCETGTKHFDHSRRLSKAIKEDNFDNMFDSHLSEKYLNINSNRHLNLNENFEKKLFERTEKMMHNSECKCAGCATDGEMEKPKYSLFSDNSAQIEDEEIEDDNVEINMKTALLSEVYFGKRKKNKDKK